MDEVTSILSDAYQSGGIWLPIALLLSMIIMQGVKSLVKRFWNPKDKFYRTGMIFIAAYFIGFQCGVYFIEGEDSHKWAVLIGIINPMLYFMLVQYAKAKNHIVLLSALKMRPVVEVNGEWKLHETQTFMVNKK